MTEIEIAEELRGYVRQQYPDMVIEVRLAEDGSGRREVYFIEERFRKLYPLQRYHYLQHLIPEEFCVAQLGESTWYECAPGEDPAELMFPDDELVEDITADVLGVLRECGFFERLDAILCGIAEQSGAPRCEGDFSEAKKVLVDCGRPEEEFFDVFHVLMNQGAYCDCEILYNVAEESRFKQRYWQQRGLTSGCT
jgi:hypothetical protein